MRRLVPYGAAPCGRDSDRPRRVAPERELQVAGGDGRRRPSTRASCEPPRRDRIRNGAVVRVLRRDSVGELVEVRLPRDGESGGLEQLHRVGAHGTHVVGEECRAVGRRQLRGVEQVLDRHRFAAAWLVGTGQPDSVHYWKWR